MVRVGVLTSSRADYGVYLPLIKAMDAHPDFSFELIAFGTHVSKFHGYTINEIEESGYNVPESVVSILSSDTENAISTSTGLTALKFADFWERKAKDFDWVLCLGDRFEMFAAVTAGVPYGIKFAHFYGGDYSPGAIDNVYRNCLTHSSIAHFVSTQDCANRLKGMVPSHQPIEVVGILSLEETLNSTGILSKEEFSKRWNINFDKPTILITVHPETISPQANKNYSEELYGALSHLAIENSLVITMPNSDTNGIVYRDVYQRLQDNFPDHVTLIENFGLQSYFSCMMYANVLLGNTSSGVTEAATFRKYVVNVGDRQKGRSFGENIIPVPFDKDQMISAVNRALTKGEYEGKNIYFKANSLDLVMKTLQDEELS